MDLRKCRGPGPDRGEHHIVESGKGQDRAASLRELREPHQRDDLLPAQVLYDHVSCWIARDPLAALHSVQQQVMPVPLGLVVHLDQNLPLGYVEGLVVVVEATARDHHHRNHS